MKRRIANHEPALLLVLALRLQRVDGGDAMKPVFLLVASLFTFWGLFVDRLQWDSLFWPWSDLIFWALFWAFLYVVVRRKR